MAYAERTEVSVAKTRAELETLLNRHKANAFGSIQEEGRAILIFQMQGRRIRFLLPLPLEYEFRLNGRNQLRTDEQRRAAWEQACRSRWRALFLCVKDKLESIESSIETFEQAFLANIQMADGSTAYDRVKQPIALEYQEGTVQLLLEGPERYS